MNTGLPQEQFKRILDIFRRYPQVTDVILFGSRAKGNFREGSDIDFALKGENLDHRLLTQVEMDYDALELPWELNLVVYDTIENPDLKEHIDRIGVSRSAVSLG